MIDSSDEWIQTRSGIRERRWASPDETIEMMSLAAARKGVERAGLDLGQIDTVIVSTVTHLYQTPSARRDHRQRARRQRAAVRHLRCLRRVLLRRCDGRLVRPYGRVDVRVDHRRRAVVSDMTSHEDRSTAFIFADGAGAAVIGPSDLPGHRSGGLGLRRRPAGSDHPDRAVGQGHGRRGRRQWPVLRMEGNPVFKWASFTMAKTAAEALDRAGVEPEDLDVFVPHQANMRITDAMFRALKLPSSVVVGRDIAWQGNTSAASIPLAIEALLDSGEAHSGQTCLIIGFGAGLVYAGQVIVLP